MDVSGIRGLTYLAGDEVAVWGENPQVSDNGPLLPAACAILREMASFESAGVSTRDGAA